MTIEQLRQELFIVIETVTEIEITDTLYRMELDMAGINSIKFVQIIVDIEERYDLEFDDSLLDYIQFKNLQSFIEYIIQIILKKIDIIE